jgi:hypothetical protein
MSDDATLLRRYAEERSETAFAELVHRHIGLVYGAALRQPRGATHPAEDVTQSVLSISRATPRPWCDAPSWWGHERAPTQPSRRRIARISGPRTTRKTRKRNATCRDLRIEEPQLFK